MARSEQESAIRNPLTNILGIDSNLRVLRTLVQHGGMLSASEIVRVSKLSRDGVRRGLLALESSGMVTSSGSSHARVYRFNASHFLAPALGTVFGAEKERFMAILDTLRQTAVNKTIHSLFIYGSAARGEDGPDSDLDVGLVAHANHLSEVVESVREELRQPAERLGFLPNVVGLDFEDVRRLSKDNDPWWEHVKQDAVVLFGKRPEDSVFARGDLNG
ncbi:nucleotidyltransferase domain-containing protein [Sinorhizobium meliloti]|uniref:nucleotidyltransferase domain-containing protein n=1 Tax=Rhizobium meliloti TaxID=382 RepID=UPI001F16AE03|nr:nucleotidyltransferase domain-containing protein [Sinorhizobium meliloti]